MKRLYSCMFGHKPRIEKNPVTDKLIIVCPADSCGEATHQHDRIEDAVAEWNSEGSRLWTHYDVKWWTWLMRWWRGCFI